VAGTRTTRLAIVFASSVAALVLMMVTVDPVVQYTVDDLMSEPEKFQDSDIFVRGVVSEGSVSQEGMTFNLDGISMSILVDFSESAIPDGFDEGKTIAVRGILTKIGGVWVIESNEIQTGCPSKYES